MQQFRVGRDADGGWVAGPWNSTLTGAVSFISSVNEQPHIHRRMREVCILMAGQADLLVLGRDYSVVAGTVIILEPGEVHAWLRASADLQMLVIHENWAEGDTVPVVAV